MKTIHWSRIPLTVVLLASMLLAGIPVGMVQAQSLSPFSASGEKWLEYENLEWGYTLYYPPTWQAQVVFTNTHNAPAHVIRERVEFTNGADSKIVVDVWERQNGLSIQDWFKMVENTELLFEPNAIIGGQDAFAIAQSASCGSPSLVQTYIPFDDRIIDIWSVGVAGDQNTSFYLDILKSVYFHDSVMRTVDLSLFANSEYLLSPTATPQTYPCSSLTPNKCPMSCTRGCTFAASSEGCCGYPAIPGQYWACAKNCNGDQPTSFSGNCVWWGAYTRKDVGALAKGDARNWAVSVGNTGQLPVDTTPRVGAIVVLPGNTINHVAYVVWTDGQQYRTSDMGWCGDCGPTPEEAKLYTRDSNDKFIHCSGNPAIPTTDWNFTNCPFGWTPSKGFSASSLNGSSWVLNPASDPYLLSPILSLPATQYQFIQIKVSSNAQNTDGKVYFTTSNSSTFDESKSVNFTTTNDGVWYTYTINMASNSLWQGVITRIRIDPVSNGNANNTYDDISISKVLLVNDAPVISVDQANTTPINVRGQAVIGNATVWTLSGTASAHRGISSVQCRINGNNYRGWENASGTTNWSYTVSGLYGHNEVICQALDTAGNPNGTNDRDRVNLYVDTVSPTTTPQCAEKACHSGWYPPLQIVVNAEDNSSGTPPYHYPADVARVHYRINSGAWQSVSGDQAVFNLSSDGIHTIDYYAVDNVGNQEATKSLIVKVDATSPVMPTTATETHGVISGQWQRDISDPAFTWAAATDNGSGVAGYFIEWPTWSGLVTTPAFDPPAVRTGSYPLRVQAVDAAGNRSDYVTLFTFNYDGTAPAAPAIQNMDDVGSGVWQNQVRTPNFAWSTPGDAGSGVTGYYRYWGPDEHGTSDILVTANTFASATPFCAIDNACASYLRLRSQDGVGWQSEWATFALRYDGAPPTATLIANFGQPVVHQTTVHLAVNASDLGSGTAQMRLSNNQTTWSDWLSYTPQLYWEIPALGRRNHDIYLQVLDHAGNTSDIISTTVYFDVNAPLPKSENFHLWDSLVPAGGGIVTSTAHIQRVTIGQPFASGTVSETALHSPQYLLNPGFQAGALAAPLQVPTATTHTNLGALFASATTSATAIASSHFQLYGSMGQPSHMQTISSTHFVADLGFWAGAARNVTPEPPDPPEPPLPPECEFYSLSINDGALFTRVPQVTLNMCGPDPTQVMVSNDGGFGEAVWQPYTQAISWTLTTYGNTILPRFVYARYKDSQDYLYGNFMDDIIYDPTAPLVVAALDPLDLPPGGVTLQTRDAYVFRQASRPAHVTNSTQTELFLSTSDDSSGLAAMQISTRADFANATWEPFAAIVPVPFTEDGAHTLFVRTRDEAGNVSTPFGQQVLVDTTPPTIPPTGTLEVLEGVVGPNTMTVTLAISVTDSGSGVGDVRVSLSPAFTDTLWIPYMPLLPTSIRFTGELTPTLYVQLRDLTGNVSGIYTTTYLVDVEPPYGGAEIIAQEGSLATLRLSAEDDLSAITRVWLSPDYWFFDNVAVVAYQETLEWDMGDSTTLYVRFEDAVGNISTPTWAWPYEPAYQEHIVYLPLVLRQQ